jgi:NAD(P)-dependent dehydrogenase (short-subunit alcohol dehydrogenase family)
MQPITFITGADRGLGFAICEGLLERNCWVFAGQYLPDWPELGNLADRYPETLQIIPLDVASLESTRAAAQAVTEQAEHIDLLINNAGINTPTKDRLITESQDYEEIHHMYDINAVGPLRVVESFLPLLAQGQLKRLCFVSSEAGSIERCQRVSWYGYTMSKAALNRAVKIMFNHLRPKGYTFRLFHPGWVQTYIGGTKNLDADITPEESAQAAISYFLDPSEDEDCLVMYDWQGERWPW